MLKFYQGTTYWFSLSQGYILALPFLFSASIMLENVNLNEKFKIISTVLFSVAGYIVFMCKGER